MRKKTVSKSEFISVRVSEATKAALGKIASEKGWTVSSLVSRILEEYIKKP